MESPGSRPTAPVPKPRPVAEPPAEGGQLGVFDAVSIMIGIVIGATVFRIPWLIFMQSSGPWGGLLVWAVGGVLAFVGALCYAELATSFPRSGGDYVYLTKAFGPWAGFLFGWAQLTIVLTCSIGAMAVVFGEFATNLHDLTTTVQIGNLTSGSMYALGSIIVLTLLNVVGVVMGKWAQNFLTILKIVGVGAIIVAGLGWPASNPTEWPRESLNDFGWGSVALILVFYAYGGWNDAAFVAAEVRDPRRNIPKALFWGVGIIMALYLLVNLAYLVGLGYEKASRPGLLPLEVLKNAFGDNGAKAMSAIVMISALGAINGLIFAGARVYATLGNDHRLFSWMGHWKPGQGAPWLALILQSFVALTMVAAFGTEFGHGLVNQGLDLLGVSLGAEWNADKGFERLFAVSAPIFWIFFFMTSLSLFILREQKPKDQRPFSVPLYPVLPLIFTNMCLWMIYRSLLYVYDEKLMAVECVFVGLILLGLPLYWLSRKMGYHEGTERE